MSLNQSQLYYINKANIRKTRVIAAAISREFRQGGSCVTNRVVRNRINKELRLKFGTGRLADLPEKDYERVLGLIKNYRFLYCGKHYG